MNGSIRFSSKGVGTLWRILATGKVWGASSFGKTPPHQRDAGTESPHG